MGGDLDKAPKGFDRDSIMQDMKNVQSALGVEVSASSSTEKVEELVALRKVLQEAK